MLSKEEIVKKLKAAFWDYNFDPYQLYLIAAGEQPEDDFFTREKIFLRLLERLSWYELVDLFGVEYLKKNLTESLISRINKSDLKIKYESLRKILHGETLSSTGWSDQNRKRLKASILSDRWDGS